MSTTLIEQSAEKFRTDPEAAKTAPTVNAVLTNGHARLSAGPFNWDCDLPAVLGGDNVAPSPTAYLLGALAGCAVAFLNDTLAPQFGVSIGELKATARCRSDLGGLLGLDGRAPELDQIELDIDLDSPSEAGQVAQMREAWLARCPVFLALGGRDRVTVSFR
jgi:uncharacterized OsmC-like protein